LLSKFCDFYGRRLAGLNFYEAYDAPGEFGGDDSIAEGLGPDNHYLVEGAAAMGQKIIAESYRRGMDGVNYLSRFFTSDVWCGDPASTCDLGRILSKLHVTVRFDVDPVEKLRQKLMGLFRTDYNTPVLHEIIQTAMRLGYDMRANLDLRMSSWWAKYGADVNWPNISDHFNNDWLLKFLPTANPGPLFDYLRKTLEASQLLTMPLIVAPEDVPITASSLTVVDDEVVKPKSQAETVTVCKEFLIGQCRKKPCPFRHEGRQQCRFFKQGRCTKGRECKYSHSQANAK